MIQEQLSQRAHSDDRTSSLFYYRTPKGSLIHLIVDEKDGSKNGQKGSALKLLTEEKVDERELEILRAFQKKSYPGRTLTALGSLRASIKSSKIEVYPWMALA